MVLTAGVFLTGTLDRGFLVKNFWGNLVASATKFF